MTLTLRGAVCIILFLLFDRVVSVAQLAEHQVVALVAVGSIPITHPNFSKSACSSGDRAPASGAGCGGSIPPRRATFFHRVGH